MTCQRAARDHAGQHRERCPGADDCARAPANDETDANRNDEKADPFEEETDSADDVVWNRVVAEDAYTKNDQPDEDNPRVLADPAGRDEEGRRHQRKRQEIRDPVPVVDRLGVTAQQPMIEQPRG